MIKKLFIHSKENDYYPYALRMPALVVYIVFLFVFNFVAIKLFIVNPSQVIAQTTIDIPKLYSLSNQDRKDNGLQELNVNHALEMAAEEHGEDMFIEQYWGHSSPSGKTSWYYIGNVGYNYQFAGENLAKNFYNAESINSSWMNSQDHRDNILSSSFKDMGIAVVTGVLDGSQQTIIVEMFGALSSQNIISINNNTTSSLSSSAISITGQPINNANIYSVKLSSMINGSSYNNASISINNYEGVLHKSGNDFIGAIGVPQNMDNPNNVILTLSGSDGMRNTYTQALPRLPQVVNNSNLFINNNLITDLKNKLDSLSFSQEINLLAIVLLTLIISIDSFIYYKNDLKDSRLSNPILHLPLLISILVLALFINKGSII